MLKIKELRSEKGLTQKQLAEKIQTSNKNVWAWENEIACPDIDTLIMLARVFDVTVDYLIGNDVDEFGSTRTQPVAPLGDTLTQDEQELLKAYEKLSATNKKSILIQVKALSES